MFGLPDELWGERVAALIVKRPAAPRRAEPENLEAPAASGSPASRRRRAIFFPDEPLPRTPTGKVQKFLLVERYAELRRK